VYGNFVVILQNNGKFEVVPGACSFAVNHLPAKTNTKPAHPYYPPERNFYKVFETII
jgi:hypothetical protein